MAPVTKSGAAESRLRAMNSVNCPRCGSEDIRRSHRRGALDWFLSRMGRTPYRCRACRKRFFRAVFVTEGSIEIHAVEAPLPPLRPVSRQVAIPAALRPVVVEHPLATVPVAHSLLISSSDSAIRKLLCKIVAQPGFHTHQITDAKRIPTELQARKVDVLIVDLDLPEQRSLEAMADLVSKHPGLKIIALSGIEAAAPPGVSVLPKPFRKEMLLESVGNALVDSPSDSV